jgi:hypothetical protein
MWLRRHGKPKRLMNNPFRSHSGAGGAYEPTLSPSSTEGRPQ